MSTALRILILGGTGFIGPHQIRYAVGRGHQVTVFNRGRGHAALPPGVEQLRGDRGRHPGDYKALAGRDWDVVIDNPTTRPRWVREAAAVLAGHTRHYLFISTISVYAANDAPGADESAGLQHTEALDIEDVKVPPEWYGRLKARAEEEAEQAFPGRTTIVRPGLVVGNGDPTHRFTYWPARIARGGEILAPPANDPVQLIDVRDLAEWTIRCGEEETMGIMNATGPATRFTVGQMLEGAREALGSDATFTHVSREFLAAHDVEEWSDLPVWISSTGESAGFAQRSNGRALSAGLTFRPFADTVRDTIAFYRRRFAEGGAELVAGLSAEREREMLDAWHSGR